MTNILSSKLTPAVLSEAKDLKILRFAQDDKVPWGDKLDCSQLRIMVYNVSMFSRIHVFLYGLLHNPMKVFGLGVLVTLIMLTFDGSLWRFWSLQRGQEDMQVRVSELEEKARKLEFQIHQASSMTYIERQATDQFDYVREGDLIFVFAD